MWQTSLLLLLSISCAAGEISYSIQTLAGSNSVGDGGPAVKAQLSDAQGVAVDRFGAVYIADPDNHRVRKVNPSGVIETIAGTGFAGFFGDGGPAVLARLNAPYGVALDGAGRVYIADLGNNRVRRIGADGIITTFAGNGQAASGGDGDFASAAQLHSPRNVAVDFAGAVYITEFEGHRVRRVTLDGVISTAAGSGVRGSNGDGGLATSAELAYPAGIAADSNGALYIADSGNGRIRRVYSGIISAIPITEFTLNTPTGIATDGANGFYIADSGNRRILRRVFTGATILVSANFNTARDVAIDALGDLFVADGHRVRMLTPAGASITWAGDGTSGFRGDGGPATMAVLNGPAGVAAALDGSVYVADSGNHRVRRISPTGDISTVAGSLDGPEGLLADSSGVVWISERGGGRIRRLTPSRTLALLLDAELRSPGQVALDPGGNLFIADAGNNRILKLAIGGVVSTAAGTGVAGLSGDAGPARAAQLNQPRGIAFDRNGILYIADTGNHRIRKMTPDGLITTLIGDGEPGLRYPRSVAVDLDLNVYVADTDNHRIVKRTAAGEFSIIAGTGRAGFAGDGGLAIAAQLSSPAAVSVDMQGNLFVADLDNNRIRKLTPAPVVPPVPVTELSSIVFLHAATLAEGPTAPGEILSIVGAGIGPGSFAASEFGDDGFLPAKLLDTQVLFDGQAAPIFDVQENQVRVQVPYETVGRTTANVEVQRSGERRAVGSLNIAPTAPGIFTIAGGTGPALATNDGALNGIQNPVSPGAAFTFYATGEGPLAPAGITGKRALEPYPRPAGEVVVRVGGRPADIVFVGQAPGKVGILQIDAIVPTIVNAGAVTLSLAVGSSESQGGVTIFIK